MEISIPGATETTSTTIGLWPLVNYFLKLGTIGFGGPAALVGFMHRDLVEKRRWITEDTYKLSLALAQIMPGPLAAQTAIAIGYFEGGILGATLVGLSFILPSFLMVVAISLAYVAYGGLWWMQALFYAIGATVIAIIAIAAYKLARSVDAKVSMMPADGAVEIVGPLGSDGEGLAAGGIYRWLVASERDFEIGLGPANG